MASVQRHSSGRSPFWFAKYRDGTGRVVVKSTKEVSRKKAEAIAAGWEQAAAMARANRLGKAQAIKIISDILEKTTGETLRDISIKDHLNAWLKGKEVECSPTSMLRYRGTANFFLKYLGDRAHHSLAVLSKSEIQGFIDHRLKGGAAPKTVIVDIKALNNAFSDSNAGGVLFENPCKGAKLPRLKSSRRETFTPVQIGLLLQVLDDAKELANLRFSPDQGRDWKTAIRLGYYTAQRLQDCAHQTWEHVDFTLGAITFYPRKTEHAAETEADNKVVIPMHDDLARSLMELAGSDKPENHLCPSLAGRDSGGKTGLSQQFKAIMRAAGIDPKTSQGKGAQQFSRLSFHSLRHSFNSALANEGVDQETRMRLTGHKSTAVNDGYTHLQIAALKKAVDKLPSVGIPGALQ